MSQSEEPTEARKAATFPDEAQELPLEASSQVPVHVEARVARLEARLRTAEERLENLAQLDRSRKQRALLVRLVLLALLLAGYFIVRARVA